MSSNNVLFFGDELRKARIKKGFTQGQLGERVDLSQPEISDLEREKAGCYVGRARKIVDVLEEAYDKLLRGDISDTFGQNLSPTFDKPSYLQSLIERLPKELDKDMPFVQRIFEAVKPQARNPAESPLSNTPESDNTLTVDDILGSSKNYVLIGEPGIGKTTILNKLALEAARKDRIPICVDLRAPRGKGLKRLLGQIRSQAFQNGLDLSETELLENDFVFLFDHLDQSPDYVVGDINDLVAKRKTNQKNQFVVGCRTNYELYKGLAFTPVTIKQLELETVKEILESRGIQQLHSQDYVNKRLLEFARNPYRLKMLLRIFSKDNQDSQDLEITNEADIYREFITIHIECEMLERKTTTPIGLKVGALASLAFEMRNSDSPEVFQRVKAEDHLHRVIPREARKYNVNMGYGEVGRIVDEIRREGLIVLSGDRRYYLFAHDSLMDFFCAWYICCLREKESIRFITSKFKQPDGDFEFKWLHVTELYAGLAKDASTLVEEILDDRYRSDSHDDLNLAAQCLKSAKHISPNVRRKVINKILREYLYGKTSDFLQEAVFYIRDDAVLSRLLRSLNSPKGKTRANAVEALGFFIGFKKKNPFAPDPFSESIEAKLLNPMVKMLGNKYWPEMRREAARALGWIGSEKAVGPLTRMMRNKKEKREVRIAAFRAIENINPAILICSFHNLRSLSDENQMDLLDTFGFERFYFTKIDPIPAQILQETYSLSCESFNSLIDTDYLADKFQIGRPILGRTIRFLSKYSLLEDPLDLGFYISIKPAGILFVEGNEIVPEELIKQNNGIREQIIDSIRKFKERSKTETISYEKMVDEIGISDKLVRLNFDFLKEFHFISDTYGYLQVRHDYKGLANTPSSSGLYYYLLFGWL